MSAKTFCYYLMTFTIFLIASSCSLSHQAVTVEDIKSGKVCFAYEEYVKWKEIEEKFGEPDHAPVPSGESLSENSRVYRDKIIIFYTDRKKTKIDGKTRYEEVITKLEICDKK